MIEARTEKLVFPAYGMRAYVWRQPDDAGQAVACGRLPAGMADDAIAGPERTHARVSWLPPCGLLRRLITASRPDRPPVPGRQPSRRSFFRPGRF